MISKEHNLIFIHIPKCAGTSIEYLFNIKPFDWKTVDESKLVGLDIKNNLPLQHASPQELIDLKYLTYNDFKEKHSFAIVRNTYDRLVSAYLFMLSISKIRGSFENYLTKSAQFKTAIEKNGRYTHLRSQLDYLFFDDGKQAVKDIFSFEELSSQLPKYLQTNFRKDFSQLRHEKRAKRKHYSFYYNRKTIQLVDKIYSREIEFFKYKFEKVKKWYQIV